MPVSASIYDAIGRGVQPVEDPQNALLKALKLQGAQQELQTGSMKMDEYRRGVERNNKLQQLLAGDYADDDARAGALVKGGYLKEADDYLKGRADVTQKRALAKKTENELVGEGLKRYREQLDYIESPQTAARWLQAQYQDPTIGPVMAKFGPVEEALARIPQDPQAFAQWREQQAGGMEKYRASIEQKPTAVDAGGTKKFLDMNPKSPTYKQEISSTTVTESEAQRLKREQDARDAAAGRGVQIRGQDKVDARARDANLINKELAGQKTALEIQALQDKATERDKSKQAAVSSVESQIRVIDKALAHPGMKTATGLSGTIDPRNYVAGTDATDFRVVLDQIGGAAFLQAFESLKGGGAITEVEGKKATDAIARLNRAQSDSEFETSLNELRGVMETGYKRMAGKDYQRPNAPAKPAGGQPARITGDAEYNALPSGATFVGPDGKTRRKP